MILKCLNANIHLPVIYIFNIELMKGIRTLSTYNV